MKIIDLLIKIANGEELPEKFMYKGHLYYKQKMKGICYRCDELNEIFEECLVLEALNDTIEIIEEEKKIENQYFSVYDYQRADDYLKKIETKLNEIIDYINNKEE